MIPINTFKKNMLSILNELSSQEYQDRVWLRGEGPQVSSFEDATCDFWDLLLIESQPIEYWHNAGLSDEDIDALNKLSIQLDLFLNEIPQFPSTCEVLQNKNWRNIRSSAAELLLTLKEKGILP